MVKIFVGRLTDDVQKSELEELFKKYGEVTDCSVLKNYGFVHMADLDEAKAAIAGLDKHELQGNKINVELSTTKVAKAAKLFVGNLPAEAKSSELHKMFKGFGTVIECDVVKNFAFVHMGNETMARDAIQALNGKDYKGNKLAVQMAKPKRSEEGHGFMFPGDFRGRGRGFGRGFMGPPMRGVPRFRGRPVMDDRFMDPSFPRRGGMRPRAPALSTPAAGLGAMYDHDLLSRGLARRNAYLSAGDPYMLREREALARQLDAEAYADPYRGLGSAPGYDFAADLSAAELGLEAGYGRTAASRYGAGRLTAFGGAAIDRYSSY